MGAAARKAVVPIIVGLALVQPAVASAERCTGVTSAGARFPTCFDVGNRLFVAGGTDGFGFGVRLRHAIDFDDEPDLIWKLEHRLLEGAALGIDDTVAGAVYRGRFLRHARDGHIVLPLGSPRKVFLPFDVGAEASVGTVRFVRGATALDVGAVRIAGLIDLSRTPSFRRRLAVGAVARWDMRLEADQLSIEEHTVVPFSGLTVNAGLESASGLTTLAASIEATRRWSSERGWHWAGEANVELERTVIAINDRPLTIQLAATGSTPGRDLTLAMNARFSLVARTSRSAPRLE